MSMLNAIQKLMEPLKRRVLLMIGRAIIQTVDDSKGVQTAKISVLADETIDKVERFQQFGITSNPPLNSEAVVLFLGGNREHGIIVGIEDRNTRKKELEPGETAIYTSDGSFIHFKLGGKLLIKNDSNEWVAVKDQYMQALIDARTMTLMGPQPLLSRSPNETFLQIKDRFKTFKDE